MEKNVPISNLDTDKNIPSSDTSDLSTGEGQNTQTGAVAGVAGVAGLGTIENLAVARGTYNSQASDATTTDDDTKQLLKEPKKKRSWAKRLLGIKDSGNKSSKSGSSKSDPKLQEDSSVSSWSRGETSSPETSLNLYGVSTKGTDDMPPEMKAFGEDHGLAAAERAMEEEEKQEGKQDGNEHSDGEISKGSSNSLFDALDKAMESGDWNAVEQQTSKMMSAGDISDDDNTGDNDKSMRNLSELDSDVDTDGVDEWSNNNQTDDDTEMIDDERIEILEKLIESDDWQGIVDNSQIHTKADDSVVSEEN